MTCLCFDLDDTICDLWEAERVTKFTLLDEITKHTDEPRDMVSRTYDVTWVAVKKHYMDMIKDGLTEHNIRSLHIGMVLNEYMIDEDPNRLTSLHIKTVLDHMHVYPDAEQTIKELSRKHSLCMITNGATDYQWEKINRLSFKHLFKEIIVSQELGYHKPDREIFDMMATRMNAKADEMVYIGNDYRKDVLGANNAGWDSVWVKRLDEEQDTSKPTHIISELAELLKIY